MDEEGDEDDKPCQTHADSHTKVFEVQGPGVVVFCDRRINFFPYQIAILLEEVERVLNRLVDGLVYVLADIVYLVHASDGLHRINKEKC